jgi:hypothetical protein
VGVADVASEPGAGSCAEIAATTLSCALDEVEKTQKHKNTKISARGTLYEEAIE